MTTYWVSPSGNDTNAGTQVSPWQTLTKVKNTLIAGDTALFASGSYTGSLTFTTAGTSNAPITLRSSTKWGAKIVEGAGSGVGTTLVHTQGDYIIFDGFEMTAPDYQLGLFIESNYVTVQNCWVHDTCNSFNPGSSGGYGIGNWQTNYHSLGGVVIQNNVVQRIGPKDGGGNITANTFVHGIYGQCDNSVAPSVIQNNFVCQASGMGVSLYHNPKYYQVTNNTIIEAQTYGLDCWGDFGSGYIADYNTIQNNLFRDCGPNSAYASQSSACGTHNVFRTNIAYGTYVRTYDYTSYDFLPGTGNPLQTDTNLPNANPLFLNYQTDGSGDYHLIASSPCVGRGTTNLAPPTDLDGNTRPWGKGTDIGCYERTRSNQIVLENQNLGTTAWQYTNFARLPVQAYADATSYDPGGTVTFFVSTQVGGTSYSFAVYRLGYYSGTGGCLKYTSGSLTGVAQGYYDSGGTGLVNCPTAIIDNTTHLCEAGWSAQATWSIPNTACTGVYLAIFTDTNGFQTGVTFVVRGSNTAEYLAYRPDTTDQAYNDWGGYSLYTNPTVGVKVSFNRPLCDYGRGTGSLLQFELPLLQWLEQQGYDLCYLSNIDIHVDQTRLYGHKVILSTGHDEYWTKTMRDSRETARDTYRISLAFMGANASYWQCRLENDNAGHANRTVVCYKVTTAGTNLANDPQYGVNTAIVTSQWRDAVLGRPENSLLGIMYSGFNSGGNTPWTVDASADHTYFAGTGLTNGTSYGSDLVGYEWDKIQSGSPTGLKTIGTSNVPGGSDTSNTTFYRAASGALVFATGSVSWTWALGSYRYLASSVAPVPGMGVLLANVMAALKGSVYSMVHP